MKNLTRVGIVAVVVILAALPVVAQENVNPLDVLIDAFKTPAGREFTAQFLKDPKPGSGQLNDPRGDFEHSTGQAPGYTPDHIDILGTWSLDFRPMPVGGFFTPTDLNHFWAPTGMYEVPTPDFGPFYTFTGDMPQDGTQYDDGALLFGFTLAETPPVEVPGRCEYVVWVNDQSRGDTFVNQPAFPRDPAGGTNVAFGLGINPAGEGGPTSTFTLELTDSGGFAFAPEVDVRAFITPGYVGLTVPMSAIGDLAGVNFYTFCVDSGFGFAPENTGADQTGLVALTADDLGIVAIEPVPVVASTTTTSTATTSTTLGETTTTASAVTSSTAPAVTPSTDEGGFPWWILILGGLGLGGLGWFLFAGGGDKCKELYDAWVAAQKACDEAQSAADAAADDCEESERELEDLEDERKELCKAWPPACWTTEDGGWVEDDQGNRITSRDLHMKRVALGEVWSDYQNGDLSAQEVEAEWRRMDTPEFRQELRNTNQDFKDELADIDADLAEAKQKATADCKRAVDTQKKADDACAAAEAARKKYEDCIGAAVAAAASDAAARSGEDEGAAPSAPGGTTTAPPLAKPDKDPCEGVEPKRKYEKAGKADQIRVNVDFSVITGVSEGSERRIAEGKELAFNLADLARDLDFVGDMAGARSAGLHVGGALSGFSQGKYLATSAGIIQGGVDAAMATDLVPEIPTDPMSAGIEFLEGVAKLGSTVAKKVTAWMEGNQIMLLRTTMFYQVITATPYRVLECRPGVGWVCAEKVWEYEVGRLQRLLGKDKEYIVESKLNKARFQAEIRRQSQNAANLVRSDARRLIAWRARHEPGPCQ